MQVGDAAGVREQLPHRGSAGQQRMIQVGGGRRVQVDPVLTGQQQYLGGGERLGDRGDGEHRLGDQRGAGTVHSGGAGPPAVGAEHGGGHPGHPGRVPHRLVQRLLQRLPPGRGQRRIRRIGERQRPDREHRPAADRIRRRRHRQGRFAAHRRWFAAGCQVRAGGAAGAPGQHHHDTGNPDPSGRDQVPHGDPLRSSGCPRVTRRATDGEPPTRDETGGARPGHAGPGSAARRGRCLPTLLPFTKTGAPPRENKQRQSLRIAWLVDSKAAACHPLLARATPHPSHPRKTVHAVEPNSSKRRPFAGNHHTVVDSDARTGRFPLVSPHPPPGSRTRRTGAAPIPS